MQGLQRYDSSLIVFNKSLIFKLLLSEYITYIHGPIPMHLLLHLTITSTEVPTSKRTLHQYSSNLNAAALAITLYTKNKDKC